MAIELLLEGQLEKESDRESFAELWKEVSEDKQLKMEDYDTTILIEVCPEGSIECTFEGTFISVVARSEVAGPGFHAFVAQVYDDIIMKSGLAYEVLDPTQYFENRDFESLKYKYFYPWLSQMALFVVERSAYEKDICICWNCEDYRPKYKEGFVVTPMGYIALETFQHHEIEELAEIFFIWNAEKKDAKYYRNAAFTLLWKACFFAYSLMNENTSTCANTILDYLEAAYEVDNLLKLPYDIYEDLCTCVGRIPLLRTVQQSKEITDIGYRKDTVYYPFGNWRIPSDGFAERTLDIISDTLHLLAPYYEELSWSWLMKAHVVKDEQIKKEIMKEATSFSFEKQGLKGVGIVHKTLEYFQVLVQVEQNEERLVLDCYVKDEKDVEKLTSWCMQVVYFPQKDAPLIH